MTTFAKPEFDIVHVPVDTNGVRWTFFYARCRRCGVKSELVATKPAALNHAIEHGSSKCIEPIEEGANGNPV